MGGAGLFGGGSMYGGGGGAGMMYGGGQAQELNRLEHVSVTCCLLLKSQKFIRFHFMLCRACAIIFQLIKEAENNFGMSFMLSRSICVLRGLSNQ